jgi:hypothetical protein
MKLRFDCIGLVTLLLGCEAGSSDDDAVGARGGNGDGGTTSPTTTTSSDGGAGAGFAVGGSGGAGNGTSIGCSPDLKQVVDEQGNVLETCGPDEGCAGGMCVPACEAAAASKGSIGCDYLISTPYFYVGIAPPCFAAFVTNNWDKDVTISVSRGGQSYDATQFSRIAQANPNAAAWPPLPATGLPPGEVAVVFLSQDPASFNATPLTCPVAPALSATGGSAVAGTNVGAAWSIQTNAPVTVYDIVPYGGASSYLPSAQLVLPTSAWGTNVVATLPPITPSGVAWGQVVALEPTTLSILPSVTLPGGGAIPTLNQGVTGMVTLQAGEYLQWSGPEMTGSILQADKPFAFIGGNTYQCYTSATSSGGGCDSGHQLVPPVSALANDYIGIPFTSRSPNLPAESIQYRMVGVADGTTLTFEPPVPTAPASLALGQSVTFEATWPFRVTSQGEDFPFYLGQSMSGCFVGGFDCVGDEDYVVMLPPAQWLSRYVFFTDPSYPSTNLVFVRRKVNGAFSDVTLECSGTVSGWQPIGAGDFEIANVDVIRNNVPNGACTNGPQLAFSDAPFGLMVWGLSSAASYGYPAGGNASTINTVVVPPVPQ